MELIELRFGDGGVESGMTQLGFGFFRTVTMGYSVFGKGCVDSVLSHSSRR